MSTQTPTSEQILGIIEATLAIGDAIREMGEVPSGELYARLMPTGISLDAYMTIIDVLTHAGVVKLSNHMLTWIGPARPTGEPIHDSSRMENSASIAKSDAEGVSNDSGAGITNPGAS